MKGREKYNYNLKKRNQIKKENYKNRIQIVTLKIRKMRKSDLILLITKSKKKIGNRIKRENTKIGDQSNSTTLTIITNVRKIVHQRYN